MTETSHRISQAIVDICISDNTFPFLISFPRTGSHWLRMMMELYFEKPSLVRAFYYPDANSFTCFHTHDEDLSVKDRDRVVYLYRNPSETIYSQMNYYQENLSNTKRVNYWASLYGRHLNKWLYEEEFTRDKVVLTYENLKSDLTEEFAKLAKFFNVPYDKKKVLTSAEHVTKERVKEKTQHDAQVVNLKEKYTEDRNKFRQRYDELICKVLKDINPSLLSIL